MKSQQVIDPSDQLDVAKLYEDGKHRRYSLLFAVNGGSFAVAKLLAAPEDISQPLVGSLRLTHLALGMVLFTTLMVVDIDAFAGRMKRKNVELYQNIGAFVLLAIGSLLVAGWMMVGFGPLGAALAVIAHVLAALAARFQTR